MIRINLILLLSIIFCSNIFAQDVWTVPDEEAEKVSFYNFDEDFALEGQLIYENSCKACHGNPGQGDYTMMSPSPGDVIAEKFQNQKDGSLFYKINYGRGSMPGFGEAYTQDEIWSLVAYIRSFNKNYEQPKPNIEGVEIPVFSLETGFDDNVDKLVVKAISETGEKLQGVAVSAYVKGLFGKHLLGKDTTNQSGIAYIDVDTKIPGDENGNIEILIKAQKGYGTAKSAQKMNIAAPTERVSAIAGRHLWSTDKKAPLWLKITFFVTIFGIWGAILTIVIGLRKIKKLS